MCGIPVLRWRCALLYKHPNLCNTRRRLKGTGAGMHVFVAALQRLNLMVHMFSQKKYT